MTSAVMPLLLVHLHDSNAACTLHTFLPVQHGTADDFANTTTNHDYRLELAQLRDIKDSFFLKVIFPRGDGPRLEVVQY